MGWFGFTIQLMIIKSHRCLSFSLFLKIVHLLIGIHKAQRDRQKG